jgi:small-conductance mechanosensitive channel
MGRRHQIFLLILLLLTAAAVTGMMLTAVPTGVESEGAATRSKGSNDASIVDQRPLRIARRLAAIAVTQEEQALAKAALHLADHEVDQAFATALRNADSQPSKLTPQMRALQDRVQRIQVEVSATQDRISQLTARAGKAKGSAQDDLQEQIQVAQAELALSQDELQDAQADLERAGGKQHNRLQQLMAEHETAEHGAPNNGGGAPANATWASSFSATSLIGRFQTWNAARTQNRWLGWASQRAATNANFLAEDHEKFEQSIQQEQTSLHAKALLPASGESAKNGVAPAAPPSTAKSQLSTLHRLSQNEKDLADLDKRIQDFQGLSGVYSQWAGLVATRQSAALHEVIKGLLWIILTVLAGFLLNQVLEAALERLSLERKQQLTLRSVVRFATQVIMIAVTLLVIFGSPSQLSTILGLAGAGLTVVLKDFIVSFLGWFAIMGRNGIRAGDWVEINGVRGEVVEIGLLRTVLLETGNWTGAGHPTGRRVAFLNSYAVSGYYFNFTTSGQWLWDELNAQVPGGKNPYELVQKIEEVVRQETAADARLAQEEWQRLTHRYGVRPMSAEPQVNVRLAGSGLTINIRYITRAYEWSAVHSRLSQAIAKIVHGVDIPPDAEPVDAKIPPPAKPEPSEV